MTIYIQYNLSPCNNPNNGIGCGFVVHFPTGGTHQQINNSDQQHETIKYDFNTMVEVNNQLNKKIDLTVYNN